MTNLSAAVEIQGLQMRYSNGHQALAGVDLRVDSGQLVALVGANGAGKSTLLRCLIRLQEPTAGQARIGGAEVTGVGGRALRRIRRDVGFVFQRFNLVDRLSAFRNVVNGAVAREGTRCVVPALVPSEVRLEAMECLARVGLADLADRRVDRLSGGQQQRVAIARSLMQRPKLILADEPVASLDPVAGQGVMELLRDVATERGITVIAALHQVEFALEHTERIIGLKAGRIVLDQAASLTSAGDLAEFYGAGLEHERKLEKAS
ncbi:phosphonate ABC transporter ATP-binding protein [Arthrobacter sulfonylureivorans]|uniref:Phosphonate ABC transporter ATP-binding protein n=1 Tax=Arthrobacter sulfonylureivorans TaxID=2486855 RepID=A0ABY3WBU9_9MICC|nr:phosphonate ABC transporter ATP-binding protein [Arthrobacter sulfonylureivorans]UNK47829.1 phosphonate ABC transporter ATP-binding protein [Arthrobacter sulfonylureivorans]